MIRNHSYKMVTSRFDSLAPHFAFCFGMWRFVMARNGVVISSLKASSRLRLI
jgi:hypothetical protein